MFVGLLFTTEDMKKDSAGATAERNAKFMLNCTWFY